MLKKDLEDKAEEGQGRRTRQKDKAEGLGGQGRRTRQKDLEDTAEGHGRRTRQKDTAVPCPYGSIPRQSTAVIYYSSPRAIILTISPRVIIPATWPFSSITGRRSIPFSFINRAASLAFFSGLMVTGCSLITSPTV